MKLIDKIVAAQDASKMLIAAFCDLEQTFADFSEAEIREDDERYLRLWDVLKYYRTEYYRERRMREYLLKCANQLLAAGHKAGVTSPRLAPAPAVAQWIKASEKQPDNGVLVVVRTKDGATYFGRAYDGKLMSNVVEWYPLPD